APANYLDVDTGIADTLTAVAFGNIWLAEADGSMNVDHILAQTGNVDLRADFSILDRASATWDPAAYTGGVLTDPALPAPDVFGNSIKLTALTGGIGEADNFLDIITRYSNAGAGTLTVSATADLLNVYIIELAGGKNATGDLYLDTVETGPDTIAFITAQIGSIFNGHAVGDPNILGGNTLLFAAKDIGKAADHITTALAGPGGVAGHLQARSTTGDTWIDNHGDLTLGGNF